MAEKKSYPLRLSAKIMEGMQRWAEDDLRSLNAQIEFVLREALHKADRLKPGPPRAPLYEEKPDKDAAN